MDELMKLFATKSVSYDPNDMPIEFRVPADP